MPSYSLIEYKLRRYFYLGHEYSMYVPTTTRTSFWKQQKRHYDDVTGVRIIGKIVKKNKTEEINSIVPIILKVKEEDKLHDDKLLIFTLAICAKFNLKQCVKMVADAYTAVSSICTDGLKLLMFVKFCRDVNVILHNEGYLPNVSSGFGNGFRKAMNKWYLTRDPLLTTEQIVRDKCYNGWSHKDIMKLIHIQSDDPNRQIMIIHTMYGMKKVEELFGPKANNIQIENKNETFENKQLKFIYNYLKQVNDMKNMNETTLRNEIELNRWGHDFKVVPQNMLNNSTILTSLVMHMPLRELLDNTFFFAKHKLFANGTPDLGLWEFILRFNNTVQLRKHHIHPIESYLEYVKYSRTFLNILKMQNNILNKQLNLKIELPEDKLKLFIESSNTKSFKKDESSSQIINTPSEKNCAILSTIENVDILFQASSSNSTVNYTQQDKNSEHLNLTVSSDKNNTPSQKLNSKLLKQKSTKSGKNKSKNDQTSKQTSKITKPFVSTEANKNKQEKLASNISDQLSNLSFNIQQKDSKSKLDSVKDQIHPEVNMINQNQLNSMILLKPAPKIVDKLSTFLSEDLIRKTLQILQPTGRRIIIAYDNRPYMKTCMCACSRLLGVHEAITLITLSLTVPEKLPNKPTVVGLNEMSQTDKIEVELDHSLTFSKLESILFKKPCTGHESDSNNKDIPDINPLFMMNWAKENNKEYDVFVFLGTNKMNFRNIKPSIKEFQKFSKKPVKIIVCCLNGKHFEQRNLSRGNMLFIAGFDKSVGKVIHSFINEEF